MVQGMPGSRAPVTSAIRKGMKNRRSIRKPYDYAEPGDYFVTVCVRNRAPPGLRANCPTNAFWFCDCGIRVILTANEYRQNTRCMQPPIVGA